MKIMWLSVCYHNYFLGDEGWGSDFDSEDDEYHEVWLIKLDIIIIFLLDHNFNTHLHVEL